MRNLCTVSCNDHTPSRSLQQWTRVPFSLRPSHHWLFFVFLITAILSGDKEVLGREGWSPFKSYRRGKGSAGQRREWSLTKAPPSQTLGISCPNVALPKTTLGCHAPILCLENPPETLARRHTDGCTLTGVPRWRNTWVAGRGEEGAGRHRHTIRPLTSRTTGV